MVDKSSKWFVPEDRPWFRKESGWPDEVPKNIDFPVIPLGDNLAETAKKYPEMRAVWFLGESMTFKQLNDNVNRFATSLNKLGLKRPAR